MASRTRQLGVLAGAAETVGLVIVAVASAVTAPSSRGWTSDTSRAAVAVSEVLVYVLFAAGCCWVTWAFGQGKPRAWTPFALMQAFAAICAWPLLQSDQRGYVIGGAFAAAAAVLGLVSAARSRTA